MIIGESKGGIYYYQNTAGPGNPMEMVFSEKLPIDIGDFSAPQLVDLNDDSLIDLIFGEKKGNLNFYKNTGTNTKPVFTLETDSLGYIDIIDHARSNYGYSVPCFFKDSANYWQLFVGSESGYLFHYKDINSNLSGKFTLESPTLGYIYNGQRSAAAVSFLNNDKYPEIISGNISGGLSYYEGITPQPENLNEFNFKTLDIQIFPNPASTKINIKINDPNFIEPFFVEIYSTIGKKLIHEPFFSQNSIELSTEDLLNGIYFCRVITGNGKCVSKKLIITR